MQDDTEVTRREYFNPIVLGIFSLFGGTLAFSSDRNDTQANRRENGEENDYGGRDNKVFNDSQSELGTSLGEHREGENYGFEPVGKLRVTEPVPEANKHFLTGEEDVEFLLEPDDSENSGDQTGGNEYGAAIGLGGPTALEMRVSSTKDGGTQLEIEEYLFEDDEWDVNDYTKVDIDGGSGYEGELFGGDEGMDYTIEAERATLEGPEAPDGPGGEDYEGLEVTVGPAAS